MSFPLFEGALTGLASLLGLTLLTVPLSPWLHPDLWPLTTGLTLAWACWRCLCLERAWRAYRAWRTNVPWQLSPEALGRLDPHKAPGGLTLGLAFPWTAAHTQVLETALATCKALPTATDTLGGLPALHAVGQAQERPLTLPFAERGHHTLLTGTTGSGKTTLLQVLIRDAIHGPGAVLVIDPKGDRALLARCAAEAETAHKPFHAFLPAFPHASVRLNVLATAQEPAEVSARIRALMPSAGGRTNDAFFEEFPLAIIENIVQAQQVLGVPWTLPGIFRVAIIRKHLERLLTRYLVHLGVTAKERKLVALVKAYRDRGPSDLLADALIEDYEWPAEHYRRITGNLIPTFRGVVRPPLAPLLSAVPPDVSWADIAAQSMVLYVGLASLLYRDIAHRIGRALLQDLLGFLGRRQAFEQCATAPPITVVLDELRQVLYPAVVDALALARSAGCALLLAQQSMADSEYALGRAGARVLASNVGTKVWCRLADDDDSATVATEGIGTCLVQTPEDGTGLSYGGMGGLVGSSHRRVQEREVPLFKPQWLPALPVGQALVRMKGEVWKLRVPLLAPVSGADQARLGLTALWATGPVAIRAEEAGAVPALVEDADEEELCDTC